MGLYICRWHWIGLRLIVWGNVYVRNAKNIYTIDKCGDGKALYGLICVYKMLQNFMSFELCESQTPGMVKIGKKTPT